MTDTYYAKLHEAKNHFLDGHKKWIEGKCRNCLSQLPHKDGKCENTVKVLLQSINAQTKIYFPGATPTEITSILKQVIDQGLTDYVMERTDEKKPTPSTSKKKKHRKSRKEDED